MERREEEYWGGGVRAAAKLQVTVAKNREPIQRVLPGLVRIGEWDRKFLGRGFSLRKTWCLCLCQQSFSGSFLFPFPLPSFLPSFLFFLFFFPSKGLDAA